MSRARKMKKLNKLADPVIEQIDSKYDIDDEDRERIRAWVRHGAIEYRRSNSASRQTFYAYLDEMAKKLDDAYATEYRGETISLGPLSAHMLFSVCPLWPFC
jgi:hypothetical protein